MVRIEWNNHVSEINSLTSPELDENIHRSFSNLQIELVDIISSLVERAGDSDYRVRIEYLHTPCTLGIVEYKRSYHE